MAHSLGSLDSAICSRLEESKAVLSDKADPEILSQVLIEIGLLAPKIWENMVYISILNLQYLCEQDMGLL